MTTVITAWRHGVTDWNERGVFQGREDIPLNERGQAQACAAAARVATPRPDVLYCSPLLRARQTAQAVVDITGLTPHIDARLTEIDVGTWVGQDLAQASALDPVAGVAIATGRDYRRSPTGETMTEVGVRVGACLREIAARHAGQSVLVVSHGGAIRMGVVNLLGWGYDVAIALGGMKNCAWTRLAKRGDNWRLDQYNAQA